MAKQLLPSGLSDRLSPHARAESRMVMRLLDHFDACGYDQVHPPLMEYEATLLDDTSGDVQRQTFRVMDPLSQDMLAIRSDMTLQVARIADSLLSTRPAPLRLCYAGQTVRTTPDTLRGMRQFRQIGIECFGSDSLHADLDIMHTAITSIQSLNLGELTLDLHLPTLVDELISDLDGAAKTQALQAISRKDSQQLNTLGLAKIANLSELSGPAERIITALSDLNVKQAEPLKELIDQLSTRIESGVSITIDPLESSGFGYYTGIAFTLYLSEHTKEVGRGGRYKTSAGNPACGFTLYGDDLVEFLPDEKKNSKTALLANDTNCEAQKALHEQGYRTLFALGEANEHTAREQSCSVLYINNQLKEIT